MRMFLLTIGLLLLLQVSHAQMAPLTPYPQDSAWIRDNYTKKEVYIPMRDGVKLFTAIYIPKDATEKHPFLMTRTPYSCAPYGEQNFGAGLWNTQRRYYARENYIFVIQDVRGRWMSEGEFQDVRPFNANKKGKNLLVYFLRVKIKCYANYYFCSLDYFIIRKLVLSISPNGFG